MPTEIPQDLLDEMMRMNDVRFDAFEKAWYNNEHQKEQYEKQYYNQLSGHLVYNDTFKEKVQPLKPHEYAASLDKDLLSRARAYNQEMEREVELIQPQPEKNIKPQVPTLEGLRKEYREATHSITDGLFSKLHFNKLQLQERSPNTPSIERQREKTIEQEIEPEL